MLIAPFSSPRSLKEISHNVDLCVVGGGLAGVCCAITAARLGLQVVVVQDRPVLGGNASSEVRLWVLGATCHMGSNNRWAREGGVIDEILLENLYRNPEGNPLIFDTVVLEKVVAETNITLLLNTAVQSVTMVSTDPTQPAKIAAVKAFCAQNSVSYTVSAPLFCDASGDGVLGFLSGAAFRMGAEAKEEFGEGFAPNKEYGELLGHSIYFYSKDTGRPVSYTPPAFAMRDIEGRIPRYRDFRSSDSGCRLWWIEYGGRMDTVHDTEAIKWELWKVVYGVWDYIKNSGKFPEAETLTLEWVGHIPGKRESRRFEGDYILRQQDLIEQRQHHDAVAFGGWALDLHPADGVYSPKPGCTHEHARGLYQIPYRCLYSNNVGNLFLGGRTMSVSHVAFGSTRVIGTLSHCAQAIAHAAALCVRHRLLPAELSSGENLAKLQLNLLRSGQHIPLLRLEDPLDLVRTATLTASSEFELQTLPPDGPWLDLTKRAWAQMLPVEAGPIPKMTLRLNVKEPCKLRVELRVAHAPEYHTPCVPVAESTVPLEQIGEQDLELNFGVPVDETRYLFLCVHGGVPVELRASELRVTGLLSLSYPVVQKHLEHSNPRYQEDKPELGIIGFEKWCPERRPNGQNLAIRLDPPLRPFSVQNLTNGVGRPTRAPNAWVAAPTDLEPQITLIWPQPRKVARLELCFDTDFDHPMESVLMGHPEREMPFCVRHYRVEDSTGRLLWEKRDNHLHRNVFLPAPAVLTDRITIRILEMCGQAPPALFSIMVYGRE